MVLPESLGKLYILKHDLEDQNATYKAVQKGEKVMDFVVIRETVVQVGVPIAITIFFMCIVNGWNDLAKTKVIDHLEKQSNSLTEISQSLLLSSKILDRVCSLVERLSETKGDHDEPA